MCADIDEYVSVLAGRDRQLGLMSLDGGEIGGASWPGGIDDIWNTLLRAFSTVPWWARRSMVPGVKQMARSNCSGTSFVIAGRAVGEGHRRRCDLSPLVWWPWRCNWPAPSTAKQADLRQGAEERY
jgi:hypothetical protein